MMEYRDPGCRWCRESTAMDCGRHGPRIYRTDPHIAEADGVMLRHIREQYQKLEAENAALRAERDGYYTHERRGLQERVKFTESFESEVFKREQAEAERDRLVAALERLVARLDFVHADAGYQWVWQCAQLHGRSYQGPKYDTELEAARAALRRTPE